MAPLAMARNETFIGATPRRVFDLLSDPGTYPDWVVGAREIRAADTNWPAVGSAFAHSVGRWPVVIKDRTWVTEVCSPERLELLARARPLNDTRIAFELQPEGRGTRVILVEEPANRVLSLLIGPVGHALVRLRNAETLRRLKRLAELRPPQRA